MTLKSLQSQQSSDGLQQQVSTEPQDEKTGTEITHAEETDAWRSRYEDNQQRYPEWEVEYE